MKVEAVCVYCASSPRTPPHYLAVARDLGARLARADIALLYGGGAVGMMGAVADGALAEGGRVVGVRPEFISELEDPHPDVAEMIFTDTMHQRKQLLVDRADAFVALPGAIGTLDELVEIVTWRRLGLHNHPICVANVDGFFDPLRAQFQRMVDDDFVAAEFLDLVGYADDAAGILEYFANHDPAPAKPIIWQERRTG